MTCDHIQIQIRNTVSHLQAANASARLHQPITLIEPDQEKGSRGRIVSRAAQASGGQPGPLKDGDECDTRFTNGEDSLIAPDYSNDKVLSLRHKKEGSSNIAPHFASFDIQQGCVMMIIGKKIDGIKQK